MYQKSDSRVVRNFEIFKMRGPRNLAGLIPSKLIRWNTTIRRWPSKGRRHSSEVTRCRPIPPNLSRHQRATVVSLCKGYMVLRSRPVIRKCVDFLSWVQQNRPTMHQSHIYEQCIVGFVRRAYWLKLSTGRWDWSVYANVLFIPCEH